MSGIAGYLPKILAALLIGTAGVIGGVIELHQGFFQLYPAEATRQLDNAPAGEILAKLSDMPRPTAARVFARLNPDVATALIPRMEEKLFQELFAIIDPMVVAGLSGAVIPILLKGLGEDPVSASSIVLTTVTDVVGLFTFLGLATILATLL